MASRYRSISINIVPSRRDINTAAPSIEESHHHSTERHRTLGIKNAVSASSSGSQSTPRCSSVSQSTLVSNNAGIATVRISVKDSASSYRPQHHRIGAWRHQPCRMGFSIGVAIVVVAMCSASAPAPPSSQRHHCSTSNIDIGTPSPKHSHEYVRHQQHHDRHGSHRRGNGMSASTSSSQQQHHSSNQHRRRLHQCEVSIEVPASAP